MQTLHALTLYIPEGVGTAKHCASIPLCLAIKTARSMKTLGNNRKIIGIKHFLVRTTESNVLKTCEIEHDFRG
ncbi:hypothetical protein J4731_09380 [Providencia rettgeri]|nr:hypothetical protein [Providencia rettgeri]